MLSSDSIFSWMSLRSNLVEAWRTLVRNKQLIYVFSSEAFPVRIDGEVDVELKLEPLGFDVVIE